jgi:ABC-type microcin C transport system permease subunit YejE
MVLFYLIITASFVESDLRRFLKYEVFFSWFPLNGSSFDKYVQY